MKYLIGLFIGLIIGIVLFIIWKKIFGKYLPMEDSVLLKIIFAINYLLAGIISCSIIIGNLNIYGICVGVIFIVIALIISYGFGIYYKVIATKNINV